jgi:hypothetical protein
MFVFFMKAILTGVKEDLKSFDLHFTNFAHLKILYLLVILEFNQGPTLVAKGSTTGIMLLALLALLIFQRATGFDFPTSRKSHLGLQTYGTMPNLFFFRQGWP